MKDFTKKNLREFGFGKQVDNAENGVCALCGSPKTKREDFKDALSWKEFQISGMCQTCEDNIFG